MPKPADRPPFRADHVGSLLRPRELAAARARRKAGMLSADELRAITEGANNIEAKGTRYPEKFMTDVDREI